MNRMFWVKMLESYLLSSLALSGRKLFSPSFSLLSRSWDHLLPQVKGRKPGFWNKALFYIKLVSSDIKPRNCKIKVNTFDSVKNKKLMVKEKKSHPLHSPNPPGTKSKHVLQIERTVCQILCLRADFLIYKEPL